MITSTTKSLNKLSFEINETVSVPFEQSLENKLAAVCTKVIVAKASNTIPKLASLMIEHQVSCLLITDECESDGNAESSSVENHHTSNLIGLVSEHEMVKCQLSENESLSRCARDIMRPLNLCIFSPEISLFLAYQTLVQQNLQYGMVERQGKRLGLLSRTSLLQAFDPVITHSVLEETKQQLSQVNEQLERTQEQLHHEKLTYQQAQLAFDTTKVQLQQQSDERTAELAEMNIQLKKDLRKRKRVEDALKQTLTTLQKAQIQVIQNERMAGLGHFVAGVAHEINNPINFIHGNIQPAKTYAEELLRWVSYYKKTDPAIAQAIQTEIEEIEEIDIEFLSEDFPKLLESMKSGTDRIREIVKSLRNFSRLDEAETKPVDIHEGIENTLMLLANRFKAQPGQHAIRVVKIYGQLPMIECFASQLNQVFWHIVSNAIDALRLHYSPESSTAEAHEIGTIQIRTETIEDARVAIHISDNGPGIDENERAKVFDPFYTTKPVGQGNGLGLSICHQIIVEKHRGTLNYHSEPGQGTEFVIELPCRPLSSPELTETHQSNIETTSPSNL